jgi:1-acyl-sn-glycerol-3-phosphate acyltransferase
MNVAAPSFWVPRSACGVRCIPAERSATARVAGRIAAAAAVVAGARVAAPVLVQLPRDRRLAGMQRLIRATLRALGIRLEVRGRVPRRGALLVANHVSWLDPLVLLAVTPARAVAKREVRGWPVIGPLVAATGAIFLDRTRPRELPDTVGRVADALRARASVAVFPEGTTTCGAVRNTFRPALFQAALDACAPVVPVGIRYGSAAAAFVGDDTLVASLRRIAAAPRLTVTLTICPAMYPEPGCPIQGRRVLAMAASTAMGPADPEHDLDLAA